MDWQAFGGRIHQTKTQVAVYLIDAGINRLFQVWGSDLLSRAYPEAAPLHPSGACSVVLKAMFDENALIPDCLHSSAAPLATRLFDEVCDLDKADGRDVDMVLALKRFPRSAVA